MLTHPPWHKTFFTDLYGRVLANQFDAGVSLRHARLIKRLLKLRRGERVLDIPCGQGRVTLPLAEMGLAMTGVDGSRSYIQKARRDARVAGLEVRFQCGDMREIAFASEFDAVVNWFGSFGYFSDPDNLRFARKLRAALKPGGRLLVEGMNKSWLLANFQPRREMHVDGVHVRQHGRWNANKNRIHDNWTLSSGDKQERHRLVMRIYGGTEIRELLRAAGFRDITLYGKTVATLGSLTRHSMRWIAIARRPA